MFTPTPKVLVTTIACALCVQTSFADNLINSPVEGTAQELEVIVVSGTRTEKALKDVAGSISVITQEDLEKQVVNDMSQLFKYDPSIQVTGSVGKAQNIRVRGMGGDRILMIKDGMRMNEGYGANGQNDIVGRGFIETDTLKQVEVAKGGASSLYGSDALGGIVVFTTKDASDYLSDGESFAGNVKAGYNDLDEQYNIGTTLALKAGNFENLLNLTYRDGNEQQNYHESDKPFEIDSNSILFKSKYNLNTNSSITFTADLWEQNTDGDSADGLLYYFRGLAPYGYNIAKESAENEKTTDAFKLNFHSKQKTKFYDVIDINVYSNESEQRDQEYGLLDINAPLFGVVEMRDMWKTAKFEQDTVGFLSSASLKINDQHTVGYGVDIEDTDSKRTVHEYREVQGTSTKDSITNKFPTTETSRAGIFFNDEIRFLAGKLTVTPSIRFDTYDMDPNDARKSNGEKFKKFDENHTSLNLGALYNIDENISIFAQYGQGFKVPAYDLAYIEHYNQATSTYIYEIVPSDDLSPEESDSYEIGLRGQTDNFAFTSAIYYNKYDNFLSTALISSETVNDDEGNFLYQHDTFQYQNIESVTIKGAELGLTYFINDTMSIFANASYQDGENDDTNEYIDSISPLLGIAGVSYESENLNSELILNWSRRMTKVNDGNAEIPGYGTLDWLINYSFTEDISMNFSARNILDKEYINYNNAAGHAEDDDLRQLAEPGRNVSMNIYYTF